MRVTTNLARHSIKLSLGLYFYGDSGVFQEYPMVSAKSGNSGKSGRCISLKHAREESRNSIKCGRNQGNIREII